MNCPFCKPQANHSEFAASTHFRALYNIAPIVPGHTLIVPKFHSKTILEFSGTLLSEFMLFSRNVTELLLRVFNVDAFNWSLQEGEIAGQTVEHLHWHIVPRFQGDFPEPGDWYPAVEANYAEILDSSLRKRLSEDQMEAIVKKLRAEVDLSDSFNYPS